MADIGGKVKKSLCTILAAGAFAFGSLGCPDNTIVPPPQNQKPVAKLSVFPGRGNVPLTVAFDGTKSYDSDGKITEYQWNFGDGDSDTTSTSVSIHTYGRIGNYTPVLAVVDNEGAQSSCDSAKVDVSARTNQAPAASFTATPDSGNAPLKVGFDGSRSYDSDGTIAKYFWDFGDGSMDSTSGANTTHTYNALGDYSSGLTVVDNEGAKSDKTLEDIVVKDVLRQIAFWSDRDAGSGEIYTADLVSDSLVNIKQLTSNIVNDAYPYFSPDGKEITFTSNREAPWLAVYTMNADGSNPKRLTPPLSNFSAFFSCWGNDNKIYFNYRDRDKNTQGIAKINPDGTGFRKLMEENYVGYLSGRPAVSPDGSEFAFVSFKDNNAEIYISDSSGTNERRNITNNSAEDSQPAWCFKGIGFMSDRDGNSHLYKMNIDGNTVRLTEGTGSEAEIAISQDSKYVLFSGDKSSSFTNPQLYIMGLDGSNKRQITWGGTAADGSLISYRYPAWNPSPK